MQEHILRYALLVRKNIKTVTYETVLNDKEELILNNCYFSKMYILSFLKKIQNYQNMFFSLNNFSTLFWKKFFKIIKHIETIPDRKCIIIPFDKELIIKKKPTRIKKTNNTIMKSITSNLIKDILKKKYSNTTMRDITTQMLQDILKNI